MSKKHIFIIIAVAAGLLVATHAATTRAQISGGSGGGIGSGNFWKLTGTTLAPVSASWSVQLGTLFGMATDATTTGSLAKGDVICRNGSSKWTNLVAGANGKVLTASSTATCGVSWETAGTGSFNASTTPTEILFSNTTTHGTSTDQLYYSTSSNALIELGSLAVGTTTATSRFQVGTSTITLKADTDADLVTITNLTVSTHSILGQASSSNFTNSGDAQLGTVKSGTWNGTAIGDAYISSAATWNAKLGNPFVNASGTNLDLDGYLTVIGKTIFGNASSSGGLTVGTLQATGASVLQGLSFTNASGTSEDLTGKISFGNASSTGGLTIGTLQATGATTLQGVSFTNASGTRLNLTDYLVSASGTITNFTGGNISSTNISTGGYITAGLKLTFGNATGTRLTLSDYLITGTSTITTAIISNASTSNVSSTNIDLGGILRLTSSTASRCARFGANNTLVPATGDCAAGDTGGGGGGNPTPYVLDASNVSLPDTNYAILGRATTTATGGIANGYSFSYLAFPYSGASTSASWDFSMASGTMVFVFTQPSSTVTNAANAATFNLWTSTSTPTSSSSAPFTYTTSPCGVINVPYATTTQNFEVFKTVNCTGTTSTTPFLTHFILERFIASGTNEIALKKIFVY